MRQWERLPPASVPALRESLLPEADLARSHGHRVIRGGGRNRVEGDVGETVWRSAGTGREGGAEDAQRGRRDRRARGSDRRQAVVGPGADGGGAGHAADGRRRDAVGGGAV